MGWVNDMDDFERDVPMKPHSKFEEEFKKLCDANVELRSFLDELRIRLAPVRNVGNYNEGVDKTTVVEKDESNSFVVDSIIEARKYTVLNKEFVALIISELEI